jgi:hypothetical protein
MELNGNGQSTWIGSRGIFASGSNYRLTLGLDYMGLGGIFDSVSITVVNGIIVSETANSSVLLPAIGSSGNFEIPLAMQPINFNSQDPNAILDVQAMGFAGGSVPSVPEPASGLLMLASLAILCVAVSRQAAK